jgi:hypothetical protein
MSEIDELRMRSTIIEETVEVINLFGAFMDAEDNSASEDQLESAVQSKLSALIPDANDALGGHVMLALIAILHNCADHEKVQEWLTQQGEEMAEELERLNANE